MGTWPTTFGVMTGTSQPGQLLSIDQVKTLLREFGIEVSLDPNQVGKAELARVELAYGLIGAAERNAINAEQVARGAGLGVAEFGEAARSRYLAAGVRSELDEFALTEWRAT